CMTHPCPVIVAQSVRPSAEAPWTYPNPLLRSCRGSPFVNHSTASSPFLLRRAKKLLLGHSYTKHKCSIHLIVGGEIQPALHQPRDPTHDCLFSASHTLVSSSLSFRFLTHSSDSPIRCIREFRP